jgi:folate-binding protein YgfZ
MSLNLIPHTAAPLADLLHRAAYAPLDNVGWIRVTGSDRVRWLNGMVTNNIAALKPGEGCYNFFLNAQGRIQGDATAWMLEESILLETAADRVPALMAMLDRFIIMDDVELAEQQRAGILLAGPHSAAYLHALGLPAPPASAVLVEGEQAGIQVAHAHSPSVPTFEIWSDVETAAALTQKLAGMVEAPAQATPEAIETLRILSGTPRYGTDIRDKDLPQETNQTRALHFAKGCYLGQEIVERIRSRGAVHRAFSGFVLDGETANPGTILSLEDKPVGELTSVTTIRSELIAESLKLSETSPSVQIALGYIRREALESAKSRGASITYAGGTAKPTALPFQLSESRPAHA